MSKVSNIHLNASIIPPAVKLGLFLFCTIFMLWLIYMPIALIILVRISWLSEFDRIERDMPRLISMSQMEDGQTVLNVDAEYLWRYSDLPKVVGYNLGSGQVLWRNPDKPISPEAIRTINFATNPSSVN